MDQHHAWHLSFANGENTRVDGVAKVIDDGDTLSFENSQGETTCMVARSSLVMAKRIDQK